MFLCLRWFLTVERRQHQICLIITTKRISIKYLDKTPCIYSPDSLISLQLCIYWHKESCSLLGSVNDVWMSRMCLVNAPTIAAKRLHAVILTSPLGSLTEFGGKKEKSSWMIGFNKRILVYFGPSFSHNPHMTSQKSLFLKKRISSNKKITFITGQQQQFLRLIRIRINIMENVCAINNSYVTNKQMVL